MAASLTSLISLECMRTSRFTEILAACGRSKRWVTKHANSHSPASCCSSYWPRQLETQIRHASHVCHVCKHGIHRNTVSTVTSKRIAYSQGAMESPFPILPWYTWAKSKHNGYGWIWSSFKTFKSLSLFLQGANPPCDGCWFITSIHKFDAS